MPARRKCGPSRWSRPTPFATSTTSAPTSSHTFAISLMKLMRVDEERVRGELHELRRRDVGAHDLGLDAAEQREDAICVLVLERADDEPVGLHEVGDRAALGKELRVRDVADARQAARRRAARGRARPCRPGPCSSSRRSAAPRARAGSRRRRSRPRAGRRRPTRSAACRRRRRGSPRPRPPRARRA